LNTQDFVTIWQGSPTLAEVIRRTGYSSKYCSQKATRLRKAGIALKRFARGMRAEAITCHAPETARGLLALEDMDAEEEAAQKNDEKPTFSDDDGADW